MTGMIATWCMSLDGLTQGMAMLEQGRSISDALCTAVMDVEDNEYYKSVGYGGLPNEDMEVELDAAFMDGTTLAIGAVGAVKNIANPILAARCLAAEPVNNILVGPGAEKYAQAQGLKTKNMLSERARIHYENRKKELKNTRLSPYAGHDTVGMVGVDCRGDMAAAVSTSGLFMKHAGRLGDSPFSGSGYYADSAWGAAAATGLGEDILKGCLSYQVVRYMAQGLSPREACIRAVEELDARLKQRRGSAGDLSVVAMAPDGTWGAASNNSGFSFAAAANGQQPKVYLVCHDASGQTVYEEASDQWLKNYHARRQAPLKRL